MVLALSIGSGCTPLPAEVDTSIGTQGHGSTTAADGTTTSGESTLPDSMADGEGSTTVVTSSSEGSTSPVDGTDDSVDPSTGPGPDDDTTTTTTDPSSTGEPVPPPSCDELYGAAPDYILCMETERECHFNATTNGHCHDMCMSLGGLCLGAFNNPNDPGDECMIIEPNTDTCSTVRGTEICVCNKP